MDHDKPLHYLSSNHLDHLEQVELHAALRVDLLRLARAHLIIDVIHHVTLLNRDHMTNVLISFDSRACPPNH